MLADGGLGVAAEQHTMGQNARAFACALQAADDVQQIGVIALLLWRHAPGEAPVPVALAAFAERQPRRPGLVGEWRIGDDVVVGAEPFAVEEPRLHQRALAAGGNIGGGEVVQDHVHAGETRGGAVLLLPLQRDVLAGLSRHLQQQRAGAAGRIVGRGRGDGVLGRNADHLGDDAADFGGGVELALALAALRGEMPHQVFVGVAKDVVVLGAILGEIERGILENGDQVAQALDPRLTVAKLVRVIEVGEVAAGKAGVGVDQRLDDLRVDLVADVAVALERDHVLEACPLRDDDRRLEAVIICIFVGHVFDEQHEQDVVLVLAGIHAAAQFIARRPDGGVEVRFLDGHAGEFLVT